MIETTLFTRLSTFAGLMALIATRIYPIIMPQGVTYPAVTYQRISTQPREIAMGEDPGIARARIQITSWGETFVSARTVADQVRLAMERYTVAGIFDVYIIGEMDLYDPDALKFGVAIDCEVVHSEATP